MQSFLSPAKINLFLHITGQRADGYHELQTAFQFLDYCDVLSFEHEFDSEIQLLTPIAGVEHEDNLIVKAARALQNYVGIKRGALIAIEKRLPMGGGLGGGSSNAATTLLALNQIWGCGLSRDQLAEIGLVLGADVPIFIFGHAAWAEGVGEKLTPVSPPEPWYLVVCPDCHVSTAKIFSSPELTRDCKSIKMSRFLSGEGRNVCEDIVKKDYPPVAKALDWLSNFSRPMMTGTGACVFAAFDSKEQAQAVMSQMPSEWQGFVAKGCNQSPFFTHDV